MPTNGFITILDLNNELKRRFQEKQSPKELAKLQELRDTRAEQKAHNYKAGAEKRKIRREMKGKSEKAIKAAQDKVSKYDLSELDKKANKLIKEDQFYYKIDDRFSEYKVTGKDFLREDFSIRVLEKYESEIEKAIEEEMAKPDGSVKKIEGLEKLLKKIEYNKQLQEEGIEEYDEESEAYEELETETEPPMFIEFIGDTLLVNL